MEGVERYKVRLLPHSKDWDEEFSLAKSQIEGIWSNNILSIQHVGSTAIPAICAKPILDIAIQMKSIQKMDVSALEQIGYEYRGPQHGSETYHLFVLRGQDQISLRHIHCYDVIDKGFCQLVGFRDYLNSHPDAAEQYAELKKSLASLYPEDRAAYAKGKEDFIHDIYALLDL